MRAPTWTSCAIVLALACEPPDASVHVVTDLELDGRPARVIAVGHRSGGSPSACGLEVRLEWNDDDSERPLGTLLPRASVPCDGLARAARAVRAEICRVAERDAELFVTSGPGREAVFAVHVDGAEERVTRLERARCATR